MCYFYDNCAKRERNNEVKNFSNHKTHMNMSIEVLKHLVIEKKSPLSFRDSVSACLTFYGHLSKQ